MNVHFFFIEYIPCTSSVNTHIEMQPLDKQFNLEPPTLRLYQLTKTLDAKIALHISSALRYLGVIFDKSVLSRSLVLMGADYSVTEESCYGTQNEQENTQNNVIERDIIREMTVDIDQNYEEKGEASVNTLFLLI